MPGTLLLPEKRFNEVKLKMKLWEERELCFCAINSVYYVHDESQLKFQKNVGKFAYERFHNILTFYESYCWKVSCN